MKIDVCFTSFKNYGHVKDSYFKVCNNIININNYYFTFRTVNVWVGISSQFILEYPNILYKKLSFNTFIF